MFTRYKIEIELTLDGHTEMSIVEDSRELCASSSDFVAIDEDGQTVGSGEFIDGAEQALLELLDNNQLFRRTGISILKMTCVRVNDNLRSSRERKDE